MLDKLNVWKANKQNPQIKVVRQLLPAPDLRRLFSLLENASYPAFGLKNFFSFQKNLCL